MNLENTLRGWLEAILENYDNAITDPTEET